MSEDVKRIDVGVVTAFAEAKRAATPYPYDRERFRQDLANLGTTAAEVEANRQEVAENTQAVADDKAAVAADKASAEQSAAAAAQSAESAHTDALAATAAKEAAQTAQGIAEEARADAVSAKGAAESAQTEANASASAATEAALAAQNAAETATANAGAASDSATAAAASAAAVSGVVAEVTAAKTEAITAIETKGTETLDSIPDDYTELSRNVDDLKSAIQSTEFYSSIMGRGSVSTTGRTFTVDKNKVEISGSSTSTEYRCVNLFGEPAAIESTFANADLSGQTFFDLNFDTDLYDLYLYINIDKPRSSGAYNYIYAATKDNVHGATLKYTLKNDSTSDPNRTTYIFNLSKKCPQIITSGNIALFAENRKANAGNTFWYWFNLAPKNHEPLTYEIKIPRSLFVFKSGYSASGIEESWEYSARTVTDIHIKAPCIITSANTNVALLLKSTTNYTNLYTSVLYSVSVDSLDARIELHTADSSTFRAEYIDDITIYTTKQGYEYFEENYTIHVKSTLRFNELGISYNKYAIGTNEDNLGLLIRNNTSKRVIAKPIVCDRNATILAGQYGTVTVNIIVGNQLAATLHNGDTYTVPANTPFNVGFATSATPDDSMVNVNYIVIPGSYPGHVSYQKITDSTSRRADAAFITDDNKIFMLGYGSGGSYTVKQGNTFIKTRTTFDHDPGHANSCNYNNGKVYVSDWTDPTLIHVYAVDTDENTLTYEKDIVLPHPDDRESIEYYVTDNEKQIFFMGWNVGRETMCYGLYVQTASGYALAWERKSLRIELLQGFTMQDHYMYLVENTNDGKYNFLGLVRLDLTTGIMQKCQAVPTGSSASTEIEAAIPIGKETFILVGVDGTTYMHAFVAEDIVA